MQYVSSNSLETTYYILCELPQVEYDPDEACSVDAILLNPQDDRKFWWEFGEKDAEGYKTVTSYNSRKLLTAISKDSLQLKGTWITTE